MILPALRATWSAPPPGPHGTMNSTGRDGYLSCASAAHVTSAATHAARKYAARCGQTANFMSPPSSMSMGRRSLRSALARDSQQKLTFRAPRLDRLVRGTRLLERKL